MSVPTSTRKREDSTFRTTSSYPRFEGDFKVSEARTGSRFPDDLVLPVELTDHRIAGSKQVPVAQILALPTALPDVHNLTVHIDHVSKLALAEVTR